MKFFRGTLLVSCLTVLSSASPVDVAAASPFALDINAAQMMNLSASRRMNMMYSGQMKDKRDITYVPPDRIECDTTHKENNRPAVVGNYEKFLSYWIIRNNNLQDRFPHENGQVKLVDACSNSAIWIIGHSVTQWTPVYPREVLIMALAVASQCRQGERAKGRAWDPDRTFTVEIGETNTRKHVCSGGK
ncbi:hypothetical protein QBC38DRAFT_451727 [Podospora fimiseda]|uniref:Ecp2 effector protein domain-containing protein n=1 Tax=Podospora fimiseda TaxID=252190 RepID=A0AAN7H7E9_9PEZI|nr:hypothetical protein QBC38DRAFT_451727 [Podospora fimiseda]